MRRASLCPLGSRAPTSWRGQLPTPHTPLCLSPDPSARHEPQASSSQDTCWVLPAARTQAWTQVCGVGSLVSPGGPCRGWGPTRCQTPGLWMLQKGAGCMCSQAPTSRPQVGVTFQAEYRPQGEKGGWLEGLMGWPVPGVTFHRCWQL